MRSTICLGLVLFTGLPGATFAQDTGAGRAHNRRQIGTSGLAASSDAAMYEDIAIMQRILAKDMRGYEQANCAACHGGGQSLAYWSVAGNQLTWSAQSATMPGAMGRWTALNPNSPNPASSALAVDGTYLKGYGVVFNVNMPPLFTVKTELVAPPPKPLSDWERARKELHAEKVEPVARPSQPKNVPDLSDFLVDILAKNGRNFTKLEPNERVTIVVTFRPGNDPHSSGRFTAGSGLMGFGTTSSGGAMGSMPSGLRNRGAGISVANTAMGLLGKAANGSVNAYTGTYGAQGGGAGVNDFELLGDLQAKQGRWNEALQAYQKALEVPIEPHSKAALYKKMANAVLHQDGKSGDEKLVVKAIEYLKSAQKSARTPAGTKIEPPTAAPALLTSKLIVSVSKGWLDEAARRGEPIEKFRQGVQIEHVAIPLPERKMAPTQSKGR